MAKDWSMKKYVTGVGLMLALGLGAAGAANAAVPVYSNDFEGLTPIANFTGTGGYTPTVITAPSGSTNFLGNLSTGQTTAVLTLNTSGLTSLTLSYDLYSILSQDGNANGAGGGPGDSFVVVAGGNTISDFTFANYFGGNVQSFCGSNSAAGYLTGSCAPQTGATAKDTLGYGFPGNGYDDATYHFAYTFAVNSPTTAISFTSNDNEGVGNEFYGIDNVSVTGVQSAAAVPEPASWAMMIVGFGMIGGGMRYRQRKTVLRYI